MKTVVNTFNKPSILLVQGLAGLLLAYFLATRAIDTGSLLQYGGTFALIILSIRLFGRAYKKK